MFTGIVQSIGVVAGRQMRGSVMRLYIRTPDLDIGQVRLGDSIATDGVCLTVAKLPGDGFWADVSAESLSCTALGKLQHGAKVNLELALTLNTPLGGHLVTGHIDGVGRIVARSDLAGSVIMRLAAPAALAKYIAIKGAITVNGVSLTVNLVVGHEFELNIVPHTIAETTLHGCKVGAEVNLEVDLVARYIERLITAEPIGSHGGDRITSASLAAAGFRGHN